TTAKRPMNPPLNDERPTVKQRRNLHIKQQKNPSLNNEKTSIRR
ncbi:34587_t:CDS:1, partial [Racocetra persica]